MSPTGVTPILEVFFFGVEEAFWICEVFFLGGAEPVP